MKRTNSILLALIVILVMLNNKAYTQNGNDKFTNQEKEITINSISNKLTTKWKVKSPEIPHYA